MDKIEDLCLQLKLNTDIISDQISHLASEIASNQAPIGPPAAKAAKTLWMTLLFHHLHW